MAVAGFVEVKGVADCGGARAFVGIRREAVGVNVHSTGVRIELAGSRRVVVTRGFDRRLLADVIGVLDEMAGLDERAGESGVAS